MKIADVITLLVELLRGRTGKWDVAKSALSSTEETIRFIAIVLAMAISTAIPFVSVYLVARR